MAETQTTTVYNKIKAQIIKSCFMYSVLKFCSAPANKPQIKSNARIIQFFTGRD